MKWVLFLPVPELSRMIPFQERNGSLGNTEALDKCLQAKKDLDIAIAEIVKAEQQVKDNWKEVFGMGFKRDTALWF